MKSISMGLELETVDLDSQAAALINRHGFGTRFDNSVLDDDGQHLSQRLVRATELVTPVYQCNVAVPPQQFASNIQQILELPLVGLTACAAKVNSSCGLHVHLGRPDGSETLWNPNRRTAVNGGPMSEWKPAQVRTWMLIGLALENRVLNVVPNSRKASKHCLRLREVYNNDDITSYHVVNNLVARKYENRQRYCWLNLVETKRPADPNETRIGFGSSPRLGTVEVRALGETRDPAYIFQWSLLWLKVAASIAYQSAESAALTCCHSSWLDENFDELSRLKMHHDTYVAPTVRSVIPLITTPHNDE